MAGRGALDIDLRYGFARRAAAMHPRLPRNLRQLGAVGPVTPPIPAGSRQVHVEVHITKASRTSAHLSYLMHAKGREGQDATLFGPGAVERQAFVRAARHDPRQFHLIVSPADAEGFDRTAMIDGLMGQMQQDLGRSLSWVAAHHYDTAHPHTHIAIRGVDTTGKELFVNRHYLFQGLQARAAEILTRMLGRHQVAKMQTEQVVRQTMDGLVRGPDDPDRQREQPFDPRQLVQSPQSTREVIVNVQNFVKDKQRIILRNREQRVPGADQQSVSRAAFPSPRASSVDSFQRPAALQTAHAPARQPAQQQSLVERLATLRPDQTLTLREHLKLWSDTSPSRQAPDARIAEARRWLDRQRTRGHDRDRGQEMGY